MDNQVNLAGVATFTRPKNFGSRIFHCLLAVAFFILFLLSVSSVGTTAAVNNNIRTNSVYGKSTSKGGYDGKYGTCILYADYPCTIRDEKYICLSDGAACQFTVTGEVLILVVAFALIVFSLFKAALGYSA